MSTRTISVVLHGQHWPDAAWGESLRAVLAVPPAAGPASVVELIEAREDPGAAVGAAAVLNRAAERAIGDTLLFIEAGCTWQARLLADLGTATWQADVLAVAGPGHQARAPEIRDTGRKGRSWNDAWVPHSLPPHRDLLELVHEACAISLDEWVDQLCASRPRLWAMRRATLLGLGGLDARMWSVGHVEDLADRAALRGLGIHTVSGPTAADSPYDAWPLQPMPRKLLAIRSALLSALNNPDPGTTGRVFAVVSALALADAWWNARISAEALRFGGSWGAARGWPRLTGLSRRHDTDVGLWPVDELGAVLPVLALDSFLEAAIERQRMSGLARPEALPLTPGPTEEPAPAPAPAAPEVMTIAEAGADGHEAPEGIPGPATPRAAPAADRFVSVIVVNWNGREHLETCFSSLLASEYPKDRLEIVCVDNGSTDGSRDFVLSRFPQVRVVALPENRGFTGGNAAGVAEARGDVLAFFNNDMRVEPGALRALVRALDGETPCVAAQVRSWNGRHIDFVRGSLNFEAHGFQDHYGEAWRPERTAVTDTFFPNGGACAITREAYDRAGGFDPAFFAYYDDVDLGFGVRINGGRVRMVHEAVVYHRHGATSRRYPTAQKRFLMERNSLWTAAKRYDAHTLDRTFGATLLLAARRIAQDTRLRRRAAPIRALGQFSSRCRRATDPPPSTAARVVYAPSPLTAPTATVPVTPRHAFVLTTPLESLAAVGEALRGLPEMLAKRRVIQAARAVPDRLVLPEFGRPLEYAAPLASYQAAHDALVEALDLERLFRARSRVLIVTHEPLRARMSGPGVRALELGRALSASCRVTIATPVEPGISDDRCAIAPYAPDDPASLRRLAEQADVLLVQGFTLTQFPFLTGMHVPVVVDLYCPFTIEFLEMKAAEAAAGGRAVPDVDVQMEAVSVLEVQNAQLQHGDFFLCASERQRDFWLGTLHTAGRINTRTYATDPSLRALIDVVPFGVPAQPFEQAAAEARARAGGPVLKGVRPGIEARDKVLLWGGSLLDWQDPVTLIRAMALLADRRSDLKLFFVGTRHPNPQVAPMRVVDESVTAARELGLLDRHVFFNDWVPYDQRAAYLAEADLGLSTHRRHLETHLSFRTRMLDYIWAALPIVCTEGDHFADLVGTRGLGLVVPERSPEALADAIARLVDDGALRERSRAALRVLGEELRWPRVSEPLRRFCVAPAFAADREPAMRAIRAKLKRSYRGSKWLKRTALRAGVSEATIQQLKQLAPVRYAMHWRNRVALARAGRR